MLQKCINWNNAYSQANVYIFLYSNILYCSFTYSFPLFTNIKGLFKLYFVIIFPHLNTYITLRK